MVLKTSTSDINVVNFFDYNAFKVITVHNSAAENDIVDQM